MSVYVDDAIWPFRGMVMCHLLADEIPELHAFAAKLGMKRKWFQNSMSAPHYDLSKSVRARAVELGAIEIDREKTAELVKYWRAKRSAWWADPAF